MIIIALAFISLEITGSRQPSADISWIDDSSHLSRFLASKEVQKNSTFSDLCKITAHAGLTYIRITPLWLKKKPWEHFGTYEMMCIKEAHE